MGFCYVKTPLIIEKKELEGEGGRNEVKRESEREGIKEQSRKGGNSEKGVEGRKGSTKEKKKGRERFSVYDVSFIMQSVSTDITRQLREIGITTPMSTSRKQILREAT